MNMPGVLTGILMCVLAVPPAGADVVRVGDFSGGLLDGWHQRTFEGRTQYRLVDEHGRRALRADSDGSASALYRALRVDLERTPLLSWSWRLDRPLPGLAERQREGDDFALRVYVVAAGGALLWRTRSLVYVWAGTEPEGSDWPNPYTANAHMIVVRSGNHLAGDWIEEVRDVRADFQRYFGTAPATIDGVAVMTDTDNSGLAATAWYGDIWFSGE